MANLVTLGICSLWHCMGISLISFAGQGGILYGAGYAYFMLNSQKLGATKKCEKRGGSSSLDLAQA